MDREWPSEPGTRVLPAATAAAWQDAQALLAAAELELARTQANCAALSQDAWHRGYEQGLREGRDETARLLLHARQQLEGQVRELEPQLLDLVSSLLIELLAEAPDTRTLQRLVQTRVRKLPANEPLTLWVAPQHAEALAEQWKDSTIAVQADAALHPTQALLISRDQSVDLSPEHQVAGLVPYLSERIAAWLAEGASNG